MREAEYLDVGRWASICDVSVEEELQILSTYMEARTEIDALENLIILARAAGLLVILIRAKRSFGDEAGKGLTEAFSKALEEVSGDPS